MDSIVFSIIIYWVTLLALAKISTRKLAVIIPNIVAHIAYGAYFLYGLHFKSEGGTALGWFLYFMFFIWGHWFITVLMIIYFSRRNNK